MSVAEGFTGWETHYGPYSSGAHDAVDEVIFDVLKARSGNGCLREYRTTAGAGSTLLFTNWPAMAAVTAGNQGKMRVRFFTRPFTPYSTAKPVLSLFLGSNKFVGFSMHPDNTFTCWWFGGATILEGAHSVNAAPTGDWNAWVQVDLTITLTEAGASDVINASAALTFPNGNQETISINTTNNLGSFGMAAPELFDNISIYGVSTNWTGDVYFDDFWMATATNADVATMPDFPAGTHVCLARITGQGADAEWTDNWAAASKQYISSSSTDDRQSVTGIGFKTSFTHQLASDLGITGTVYGLMLQQEATGLGASKFRIGGATVAGNGNLVSSLSTAPFYHDGTNLTPAQFDALQWGVESNHATTIHKLFGMNVEVLHDGLAKPPIYLTLGAGYRHKWVTFTGDLSVRKPVTGVGFRPTFVFIYPVNGNSGPAARSVAIPYSSAGAQGILSMDADGFSVGKSSVCNASGQVYAALCVRDDGLADGDTYVFHFRQGGLGSASAIEQFSHSAACRLQALFILPAEGASGAAPFLITTTLDPLAANLNGQAIPGNTGMTLDANGFHAGTSTSIHGGSELAMYWGWANTGEVAAFLAVGVIPANTVDVVVPITTFVQPLYFVLARGSGNASAASVRLNEPVFSGVTTCATWPDGDAALASRIIALDNTSFTIDGTGGTHLSASSACHWLAMAGADYTIEPEPEIESMPVGAIGLIWIEAYLPD